MGDSILFYAGGTFPYENHVAVTLLANSSLYVEVDFGDGPNGILLGENLTTGKWNNFTLIHEGPVLDFLLNGDGIRLVVEGPRHHFRFDPQIMVGGDRKPLGLGNNSQFNLIIMMSNIFFFLFLRLEKKNFGVHNYDELHWITFRFQDVSVVWINMLTELSKILVEFW